MLCSMHCDLLVAGGLLCCCFSRVRILITCHILPSSHSCLSLFVLYSWVNNTGHVTVRYLPPLQPGDARDRDHMMRLVSSENILYILVVMVVVIVAV